MRLYASLLIVLLAGCAQPQRKVIIAQLADAGPDANAQRPAEGEDDAEEGTSRSGITGDGSDDDDAQDGGVSPAKPQNMGGRGGSVAAPPRAGAGGAGGAGAGADSPSVAGTGGRAGNAAPVAGAGSPTPATSSASELEGTWSGEIRDLLNRPTQMCVTMTPPNAEGDIGSAVYTGGVACRSTLRLTATMGNVYTIQEHAAMGRFCGPAGTLTFTVNSADMLTVNFYVNEGMIPEGTGPLTRRTEPCE